MDDLHMIAARTADSASLACLLRATRARTLGLLAAWQRALPDLRVPYAMELNPPLWELGHVGWFQEWWISRNRQRVRGVACDPDHPREASRLRDADALYDSSRVAHATRWDLPLPELDTTLAYLEAVLADTLTLLREAGAEDDALYFWRLVLLHEDMHNEAAVYMAQGLDIEIPEHLAQGHAPATVRGEGEVALPARAWQLGYSGSGFAFDNELRAHEVALDAFRIDAAPVSWGRYLPFVAATGHRLPQHVRHHEGGWQQRRFGRWQTLDLAAPATHVSWDDASAWCRWARRRLPSEAEWECAALTGPEFSWGEVWEWTASAFGPYPGFVAHPYRDYSVPWFGDRRVLRGASSACAAQMVHARYRNFFPPERSDIFAGFRSAV